ncbi:MAG: TIGR04283 family arsenosugar biosynthesis glycosyltransferase [Gammaproteobacteria bacterium]|nr:TIGR04283 family arsenosugar biosynthesis glycosyltransferase [Gammaproteobacteria bacterium]
MNSPAISVVVPVLDEADTLAQSLRPLQSVRGHGVEVIVVDGGSRDRTRCVASPLCDRVLDAPRGRARQMNTGAAHARGRVLLFLHADTRLPSGWAELVRDALGNRGREWGRFDVRLDGAHPMLRVVERAMSLRSRLSGIATGDQAIFVIRAAFRAAGGFPDIALMEDVALSRALRARSRPVCLRATALTSSRRWERNGIARTIVLMWRLRLEYALGGDPERLARLYRGG